MTKNAITFEHPRTGETRMAQLGFSWRLLLVVASASLTFGVGNVLIAVYYNKLYIKGLLAAGFLARGTELGSLAEAETLLGLALPRHQLSDEPPEPSPARHPSNALNQTARSTA